MTSLRRRWLTRLVLAALALATPLAAFLLWAFWLPAVPVRATFFDWPVATTVDSEIARYFLADYLAGKRTHANFDAALARLDAAPGVPDREALAALAQATSVDVAALHFARRLRAQSCNASVHADMAKHLAVAADAPVAASAYRVLFVPGWDYAANGHITGADFAAPRRLFAALGVDNVLVPLPPTGGVEENADALARAIRQHATSGKRLLLAGASSAGPAIHLALAERLRPDELAPIAAWLNLGGILHGSPLVDFAADAPQRWLLRPLFGVLGWDAQAIDSMSARTSRARFARLQLPPSLLVINYVGVPLSGQLSRFSRDKYPLLARLGPNDGLTLLPDVLVPGGLSYVAFGSDHFFAEDPQINARTVALLRLVLDYLGNGGWRSCLAEAGS